MFCKMLHNRLVYKYWGGGGLEQRRGGSFNFQLPTGVGHPA